MTFYYVGGDGGADGGDTARFASRQTGTFPASSYSTIAGVLDGTHTTTDIALGDTICVKDTYANSQAQNIDYSFHGTVGGAPIYIESVDATAAETLKAGATDTTTGGADIVFNKAGQKLFWYGITFDSADNLANPQSGQMHEFRKCTFSVTDQQSQLADGLHMVYKDCTWDFVDSGSVFYVSNGNISEFIGCTTTGFAATQFIDGTSVNGGCQLYFTGCNFTNLSASADIVASIGASAANDDCIVVRGHNCELSSGQNFFEETPSENGPLRYIELIGCDDADAFAYEFLGNTGQVVHSTSTYVTGDTDVESATNYSYQINTTTNCSKGSPFRWMLPPGYTDLSVASTDTIRVRITSATALTQEDIAVFVGTSNTTTNTQMDFISTAESKAESSAWIPDHTATGGTALATDASEWTNAQTNEYAITVTPTNVDATSPLYPTVWIEVYTDVTFFVSSQLVFEA